MDRDPLLRTHYLTAALADVPRLLGAVDRNPYRPTFGCLDRSYWHYRTSSFPSEMYQEGALPLALVYAHPLPGSRWHRDLRVRELAIAALRFSARSAHADGSCDDYYPWERALGAAVFSLHAAVRAYEILGLDDRALAAWLERRARWLMRHDESGRLANHHALAALGLLGVARITGQPEYAQASRARIERVLAWQSDEGWFEEYGGADPGYQTVTIDCLAKYARLTGDRRLAAPLARAVGFARLFLHPDDSFAGPYGSRGTYHFYPHGMELLAAENRAAAELAEGFLRSLAAGTQACFGDDRMYAHRTGNLIEAYLDWSPGRPGMPEPSPACDVRYLPQARLLVARTGTTHTVVSAGRGGVLKRTARGCRALTDAGLILETTAGRIAVSQMHDLGREVEFRVGTGRESVALRIGGALHWARFQTATPLTQVIFHAAMWAVGRWCRTLIRRLLQRRLITGRSPAPVHLTRLVELLPLPEAAGESVLRVTDTIVLVSPSIRVRRMAIGTDHEAAYVAAAGVYQDAVLLPWTDLAEYVPALNAERRVTIVREFGPSPAPGRATAAPLSVPVA